MPVRRVHRRFAMVRRRFFGSKYSRSYLLMKLINVVPVLWLEDTTPPKIAIYTQFVFGACNQFGPILLQQVSKLRG